MTVSFYKWMQPYSPLLFFDENSKMFLDKREIQNCSSAAKEKSFKLTYSQPLLWYATVGEKCGNTRKTTEESCSRECKNSRESSMQGGPLSTGEWINLFKTFSMTNKNTNPMTVLLGMEIGEKGFIYVSCLNDKVWKDSDSRISMEYLRWSVIRGLG